MDIVELKRLVSDVESAYENTTGPYAFKVLEAAIEDLQSFVNDVPANPLASVEPAELKTCRPPSALDDVLSDAAKAGFAVHFVPIRFDD